MQLVESIPGQNLILMHSRNVWTPFRFAYANGGDESLPPAQCKIRKEISVLLYPTTLITRFIPAFFTGGQEQGFNTRAILNTSAVSANVKDMSLRNTVGLRTQSATKTSGSAEDSLRLEVENGLGWAVTSREPWLFNHYCKHLFYAFHYME